MRWVLSFSLLLLAGCLSQINPDMKVKDALNHVGTCDNGDVKLIFYEGKVAIYKNPKDYVILDKDVIYLPGDARCDLYYLNLSLNRGRKLAVERFLNAPIREVIGGNITCNDNVNKSVFEINGKVCDIDRFQ